MALCRRVQPALVICKDCRNARSLAHRLDECVDDGDGAVFVREICAAQDCAELQVRGHLCVEHILQRELAWRNEIPVRRCAGCRVSVLKLLEERNDVWFVLPAQDGTMSLRGVERRWLDDEDRSENVFLPTPLKTQKNRRRLSSSVMKRRVRRSSRQLKQSTNKEWARAVEWSLGNIPTKTLFLWRDNRCRLEAERTPPLEDKAAVPAGEARLPEPLGIFCAVSGCQFYAKTGDRCRFHSSAMLPSSSPAAA
ncbi:hypothetical protein P43SY_009008 [Pythium insidiosum]|uniref:Uncharacterized protein n=1 Tax=Pythium insidiosum TaxID=114742 RepID=A0AAD5QC39_PYTIN|nr:hypothetical protein P43SY_009008 [Pythium insidiosum]